MAKLVAMTYSQALFEFALESDSINSINEEFKFVAETFKEYHDFLELFKTPKLSVDERKKIITDIFESKISTGMLNFLFIILDKQRANEIINIYDEFNLLTDEYFGIVQAYVKSVKVLDEAEKKDLIEQLNLLTGKKVRLKTSIDPDIIGGLYIKIGDRVIDGSIKNKLNVIKENLNQIIV
ncbi:MAG: F0F1 ATP synthase subunit delta [Clostridiales bacterium]|nr:F0F1 ATP synthase subunit delta [Clostridiales bacterium]